MLSVAVATTLETEASREEAMLEMELLILLEIVAASTLACAEEAPLVADDERPNALPVELTPGVKAEPSVKVSVPLVKIGTRGMTAVPEELADELTRLSVCESAVAPVLLEPVATGREAELVTPAES